MAGLPCCDIGVDQYRLYTLLPESLESLRAGVVELACLTDAETAATDDDDFADVGSGDFGEDFG
jgi:hypothetical protein